MNYAFSSQFLQLSGKKNEKRKANKVLAFGYTDSEANRNINISEEDDNKSHRDLTGAEEEIHAISNMFTSKSFYGEDATETNFKELAPSFDILHLAVHGKSDAIEAYKSCLYFQNSKVSINDGVLYPYELYNTPLNAKLAVLSACETGLGKLQPGEGLLSVGWGFAYAGCQSLVLSLWKANDQSTSAIMKHFYKELSVGKRIDRALYKSKIQYLSDADEYSAHPSNWATFIVYGNTEALTVPRRKKIWFIAFFSLFGMLAVLYRIRNKKRSGNS
ncbi:hypothetical protein ES708_09738 [subsurface metagenome]